MKFMSFTTCNPTPI